MSKSRLPTQIRIGPTRYQVQRVPDLNDRKRGRLYKLDGYISYWDETIAIEAKLRGTQQVETLLHECIHGVATQMSLRVSEKVVETLGFGLTELLLDNPDVLFLFVREAINRQGRRKKG